MAFRIALGLVLLAWPIARPAGAADVELADAVVVHFASLEQAREVLSARDEFALALSTFDRQVRMQADKPVSLDEWLAFNAGHARGWTEMEMDRVTAALQVLKGQLAAYQVQLPQAIRLVRTTGKEEGNAAYTRQAAIMLPDKVLDYPKEQLERLLAHELFHVLSRHDRALRQKLYAVIGFSPCERITLPPEWEARRITNPDAPLIDCRIDLKIGGQTVSAAPLLYATPAKFDLPAGKTLFQYLTFRLLVLRRDGDRFEAALRDGQPVLLDPRGIEDFSGQIGKNTNYIVHPDEILADNFVLLLRKQPSVPTPRIIDEMARLLGK